MHYYKSHLGGIFLSTEIIDEKKLCCEICGGSDQYLGEFKEGEPKMLIAKANGDIELRRAEWKDMIILKQ